MTLPIERKNAVKNAFHFLLGLLDPCVSPRVPRSIRLLARGILKHYPHESDFESDKCWWCERKMAKK